MVKSLAFHWLFGIQTIHDDWVPHGQLLLTLGLERSEAPNNS